MKVLALHNSYLEPGGEDETFKAELRLLESKGHNLHTVEVSNEEISTEPKLRVASETVWNRRRMRELGDLIDNFKPDIVRCFNLFPRISPSVYKAARERDVPVVQSLHNYRLLCLNGLFLRDNKPCELCKKRTLPVPGVVYRCYRDSYAGSAVVGTMVGVHNLLGTWSRRVDAYIALTEFAKQKFVSGGLPAHKIFVKPNFVYPDPGVGKGDGGFALFVGRLSPEKGVEVLLRAWETVGDQLPLKIAGTGAIDPAIHDAPGPIEWLGHRSRDEVLHLMGQASMTIVPSIWYETFGRVMIESFAKGTPVVASDLGAMAEAITPEKDGLLFRPGDSRSLADSVSRLIADPQLLTEMRRNARAAFELRYTADLNYRMSMRIYESVIR